MARRHANEEGTDNGSLTTNGHEGTRMGLESATRNSKRGTRNQVSLAHEIHESRKEGFNHGWTRMADGKGNKGMGESGKRDSRTVDSRTVGPFSRGWARMQAPNPATPNPNLRTQNPALCALLPASVTSVSNCLFCSKSATRNSKLGTRNQGLLAREAHEKRNGKRHVS
jgi:hypothetical protein